MMNSLLLYLRIKALSLFRLYKEFPFILRVVFLFFTVSVLYFISTVEIQFSFISYIVAYLIFVILGACLCRTSRSEQIILHDLNISILAISIIKCALLSTIFILLNVYIGLFVFFAGVPSIILLMGKKASHYIIKTPYLPSSYQWIHMFRSGGVVIYLSGFFLLFMGLRHTNENLVIFSLGWLIVMPCLVSYYNRVDPERILHVYKDKAYLLKMKLMELIVNSLLPIAVCLPFIFIFGYSEIPLFITGIGLFLYSDIILFYSYYLFYPSMLSALIVSFCILSGLCASYLFYPVVTVVFFISLLPVIHYAVKHHLKSVLHE